MKTNDIITAAELIAIIAEHGAGHASIDGSMPEAFEDVSELYIAADDKFKVQINYGHEVQFHLVSEDIRAVITTGLKGRCDDMEGWMA